MNGFCALFFIDKKRQFCRMERMSSFGCDNSFRCWDLACKRPFGAVSTGTEITLRVSVVKSVRPQRMYIILRKDASAT